MGKSKIQTTASKEAMRWGDDGTEEVIKRGPQEVGNSFDIRMSEEADGVKAAEKIVDCIRDNGVCAIEANAPSQLLEAAYAEALALWEDGEFGPPLRVHDDRSMLEAQCWQQALQDEEKVFWIKSTPKDAPVDPRMNALTVLASNMKDMAGGLGELLRKELGLQYDRLGQAMISCYTGNRQYRLHIDNSHADDENDDGHSGKPPDNGMRLTFTYFINITEELEDEVAGGLDVYLTDPKETPPSAAEAKRTPKLRVAPHGDTLLLYLSERMAHQVISTKGEGKVFAIQLWCLQHEKMHLMAKRLHMQRQAVSKQDSDDDNA